MAATHPSGAGIDNLVAQPYDKHGKFLWAALAADWEAAELQLRDDINLVRANITSRGETILQILAGASDQKHVDFIKKLLAKMKSANLEVTNNKGSTALHYAAFAGNKEVARMMVEKNYRLPGIPNKTGVTPLYMAVLSSHYETTEFLLGLDKFESQTAAYGCTILNLCIENDLIGIALELVNRFDFLAVAKDENNEGPLVVLARNPSAFVGDGGGGQLRWWHRIIYYRMRRKSPATKVNLLLHKIWQQVEDQRHIQNAPTEDIAKLLFVAAERGNYEFLVDLLRRHPEILYLVNESEHTIFHIAVLNRFEPIFSLIFEIRSLQSLVAVSRQSDGSTMLHLAARLAPSSQLDTLPGPALQIHRELLWYKEVEKIVPASYRRMKDGNKRIPHDLFIEEHRELTKKGELWMMTTAQPFTVVAALIASTLHHNIQHSRWN